MAHFRTTAEVIDAAGGTPAVRDALGAKSHQHVYNWRVRGVFPGWTFLALTKLLADRGHTADPALWRMPAVAQAANADGAQCQAVAQ